jgi:hypothetical protein
VAVTSGRRNSCVFIVDNVLKRQQRTSTNMQVRRFNTTVHVAVK